MCYIEDPIYSRPSANGEVVNMITLLEILHGEHEIPHNESFLDTHDIGLIDSDEYKRMQYDKYGYVANLIDDFF